VRKTLLFVLCLLAVLVLSVSACAQTVPCPEARIILTVPDTWTAVPRTDQDDPDLCLLLEGKDLTLYVYASDAGGFLPDAFQVFTGDETESSVVTLSGMEMTCVAGRSAEGDYRIYTWEDRRNQVQMYFLIISRPDASRKAIDDIMNSIVFE